MNADLSGDKLIDMSLRMWSDYISLRPLLDQMDVTIEHLHVLGEPTLLKNRIANRHYASTANTKGKNDKDVSMWLLHVIELIKTQQNLLDCLHCGQIEGLIWIATFGSGFIHPPQIDPRIAAAISDFGD